MAIQGRLNSRIDVLFLSFTRLSTSAYFVNLALYVRGNTAYLTPGHFIFKICCSGDHLLQPHGHHTTPDICIGLDRLQSNHIIQYYTQDFSSISPVSVTLVLAPFLKRDGLETSGISLINKSKKVAFLTNKTKLYIFIFIFGYFPDCLDFS